MTNVEQIYQMKANILAHLETMTARDASDYCVKLSALLMDLTADFVAAERKRALLWARERKNAATTREADMAVKASKINSRCVELKSVLQTGQEILSALKKRQNLLTGY